MSRGIYCDVLWLLFWQMRYGIVGQNGSNRSIERENRALVVDGKVFLGVVQKDETLCNEGRDRKGRDMIDRRTTRK